MPLDPALDGATDPDQTRNIRQLKLRYFINTGNLTALKAPLDQLPAGSPPTGAMAPYVIPAMDALGMDTTAARKSAHNELRRLILESWTNTDCDPARLHSIVTLLEITGTKPPAEWLASLETTGNEGDLLNVRIEQARLNGDWATVADLCSKAGPYEAVRPEYDWYEAEALDKLGRDPEAVKPLQTYLHGNVRDFYYPQAVRLLKTIQAKAA